MRGKTRVKNVVILETKPSYLAPKSPQNWPKKAAASRFSKPASSDKFELYLYTEQTWTNTFNKIKLKKHEKRKSKVWTHFSTKSNGKDVSFEFRMSSHTVPFRYALVTTCNVVRLQHTPTNSARCWCRRELHVETRTACMSLMQRATHRDKNGMHEFAVESYT